MLVLQNNEAPEMSLPGLTLRLDDAEATVAKYDLTLNVHEGPSGLTLQWEYCRDLFENQTLERMARHFQRLLSALLEQPEQSVFQASLLSAEERQWLLGNH
jgi:non-ribosomal peptide synthetase component F